MFITVSDYHIQVAAYFGAYAASAQMRLDAVVILGSQRPVNKVAQQILIFLAVHCRTSDASRTVSYSLGLRDSRGLKATKGRLHSLESSAIGRRDVKVARFRVCRAEKRPRAWLLLRLILLPEKSTQFHSGLV